MARINLLPWRAELRRQRKIRFFAYTGIAAVVATLVVGLVHMHFEERIEFQNERNQYLKTEIAKLDKVIGEIKKLEDERQRLEDRMKKIEELQTSRPLVVKTLHQLASKLPEGVYLRELEQLNDLITIKGVSQSNARVSNFMRKLEGETEAAKADSMFAEPKLDIIESTTSDGKRISNFILRVKQKSQTSQEGKEDEVS